MNYPEAPLCPRCGAPRITFDHPCSNCPPGPWTVSDQPPFWKSIRFFLFQLFLCPLLGLLAGAMGAGSKAVSMEMPVSGYVFGSFFYLIPFTSIYCAWWLGAKIFDRPALRIAPILLLIPLLRALNLILVFAGCSRFTKLPFLFFGRECFVGPISFCSHLNLR